MKSKLLKVLEVLAVVAAIEFGVTALHSVSGMACENEANAAQSDSKHPSLVLTEAGSQKAVFQVKGIMCKSCENKIQAALRKVQGVKSVTFLKAGSKDGIRIAQVTYQPGSKVTPESLAQAVEGAGYKAALTQ